MAESTITFTVEAELRAAFDAAAAANEQNSDDLLRELMQDYVEGRHMERSSEEPGYDEWFRRKVEAGIADVRAGRVIPNEVVEEEFAARRAETRRKLAGG